MYLGLAMTKGDKADIVTKGKAVNPTIAIFQLGRGEDRKLAFKRIQ
jgi:hypothetical protein